MYIIFCSQFMKHLRSLISLFMFVTLGFSTTKAEEIKEFSREDAFNLVKQHFPGSDTNFFVILENGNDDWCFFVDSYPMLGWEHDCYTVYVPKDSSLTTAAL